MSKDGHRLAAPDRDLDQLIARVQAGPGLDELAKQMPFADLAAFRKDPRQDKIEDLFTVDLIVNYLQKKLGG